MREGEQAIEPLRLKHAGQMDAAGQIGHFAFQIGFVHPVTGEEMRFTSPPEPRFLEWLEKLRIR